MTCPPRTDPSLELDFGSRALAPIIGPDLDHFWQPATCGPGTASGAGGRYSSELYGQTRHRLTDHDHPHGLAVGIRHDLGEVHARSDDPPVAVGALPGDYYPEDLREAIDKINERVYRCVNNGVYKTGFATTQEAYEEAVVPLFETLGWLEGLLSNQRYLMGDRLTEADWRLFTTLIRFDSVYVGHFKCNIRRLVEYPRLWSYTRDLFQHEGVADTINMHHIKHHYYVSHTALNPAGVVPLGPELDLYEPYESQGE